MNFSNIGAWFNGLLERGSEYYYRIKQLEAQKDIQEASVKAQVAKETQQTKQILYVSLAIIAIAMGARIIKMILR